MFAIFDEDPSSRGKPLSVRPEEPRENRESVQQTSQGGRDGEPLGVIVVGIETQSQ